MSKVPGRFFDILFGPPLVPKAVLLVGLISLYAVILGQFAGNRVPPFSPSAADYLELAHLDSLIEGRVHYTKITLSLYNDQTIGIAVRATFPLAKDSEDRTLFVPLFASKRPLALLGLPQSSDSQAVRQLTYRVRDGSWLTVLATEPKSSAVELTALAVSDQSPTIYPFGVPLVAATRGAELELRSPGGARRPKYTIQRIGSESHSDLFLYSLPEALSHSDVLARTISPAGGGLGVIDFSDAWSDLTPSIFRRYGAAIASASVALAILGWFGLELHKRRSRTDRPEPHSAPSSSTSPLRSMIPVLLLPAVLLNSGATAHNRFPRFRRSEVAVALPRLLADVDLVLTPPEQTQADSLSLDLTVVPLSKDGKQSPVELTLPRPGIAVTGATVRSLPSMHPQVIQTGRGSTVSMALPSTPEYLGDLALLITNRSGTVSDFLLSPTVQTRLSAAPSFTLQLRLGGVSRRDSWYSQGVLHRFPLDVTTYEIPLTLNQGALIRGLRVCMPNNSQAIVRVDPVAIAVAPVCSDPSVSGDDEQRRIPVKPGQLLSIHLEVKRPTLQRWFLLLAPFLAALLGPVVGRVATLSDKVPYKALVGLIGVTAFPWPIRAATVARYTLVPNVLAGEGMTVADLALAIAWVLYVALAIRSFLR